jgi:hypothetical protein
MMKRRLGFCGAVELMAANPGETQLNPNMHSSVLIHFLPTMRK